MGESEDMQASVLHELEHATRAVRDGSWDDAVFRMDQARMITVEKRSQRRPYDAIVSWADADEKDRFEWVRVNAGTRELAHLEATYWVRDAFDLAEGVTVHVTIDPESPLG